jgi:hypothetical protein
VVRIIAHIGAGAAPRDGFGFVVGEDAGQLYIVTADHLVRGDGPDESDRHPTVIFFQDQGTQYSGDLLGTDLPRGQGDVAVIRLKPVQKIGWKMAAKAAEPVGRDTKTWFIGKLGEWYVPTRPGFVNEVEPNGTIRLDGLPVSVGTSGAPLISAGGIVGMVVTDASVFSEATPLDVIQRAFEKWNYPWQLVATEGPQSPRPERTSREDHLPPGTNEAEQRLVIWKVGSPYTGALPEIGVPPDLSAEAKKIGYRFAVRAYTAKDFYAALSDAITRHDEPDIISIDNYGVISGITTNLGSFTGIASLDEIPQKLVRVTESFTELEGPSRGWEFLLSSSKNFAAAKLLAIRHPECDAYWRTIPLTAELKKTAAEIASDYLEPAAPKLEGLEDPDSLLVGTRITRNLHVSETQECGFWGNERLAFVPMVSSYESDAAIGQIKVLLVMRKQEATWRLLTAATDPISVGEFPLQLPRLTGLMNGKNTEIGKPLPATLIAPDDGVAPEPAAGQRFGDFTWRPSRSADVIAEIVEFAYRNDARLFVRFQTRDRADASISAGRIWTTHSLWKWRVWSVSAEGVVAFSEVRLFPH